MLSKVLLKLGFNEKEADIYLCLLQRGNLVSSSIAKHTKLNRSTCYNILEKLTQKRIISQYYKNNIRYYKANPPQQIKHQFQAEAEALFQKQQFLQEILPSLNQLINQQNSKDPKIQFYQGIPGIIKTYEDSLINNQEILSIKSINKLPEKLKEFIYHEFIPKRIKQKTKIKVISSPSPEGNELKFKDSQQLRETKIIPDQFLEFPLEINIYKQRCSFIFYSYPKYLSLIIENPEISKSLELVFKLLWLKY